MPAALFYVLMSALGHKPMLALQNDVSLYLKSGHLRCTSRCRLRANN
jgi:hypothetical protein